MEVQASVPRQNVHVRHDGESLGGLEDKVTAHQADCAAGEGAQAHFTEAGGIAEHLQLFIRSGDPSNDSAVRIK